MPIPERPKKLISDICKGKAVVFVGSGLSQAAGLPSWKGLLERMLQWCDENGIHVDNRLELPDLIRKKEYLTVADQLEEALRENNLRDCLNSIFNDQPYSPTDTHFVLTRMPFAAALTTNFDRLLESAYTKALPSAPKVITFKNKPELMKLLGEEEFYVLKTHGTIDDTETLVLGRKKFSHLISGEHAYKRHLETVLLTKTLFFVGFSLSDPDLKPLMDGLLEDFKGHSRTHYALMDGATLTNVETERWSRDYSIRLERIRQN